MPSTVCSLAEDRRLLAYFAAQAAVGVHNLHLAAELSRHVEEVRDQAAELAASRDRVVADQDACGESAGYEPAAGREHADA